MTSALSGTLWTLSIFFAGIEALTNEDMFGCHIAMTPTWNETAYYADALKPYDPTVPSDETYFFEMVLDYGEHTDALLPHVEIGIWDYRKDAFSSYRSGFEIRTQRLCKRMLMFHHFENEFQDFVQPDHPAPQFLIDK